MTIQGINLELPPSLYQRIKEMADASQKPISDVLIQSIRSGIPPSLEHVPERFHSDLQSLSRLSNEVLHQIANQELQENKQQLYNSLLTKNSTRILSEEEKIQLTTLREEADLLMFRRAYAAALLKWRGNPIQLSQ